ncbi:putative beta-glucosidase from glycoside hydrolase family GH3 [Dacryopinax primogenitus]|uniref:beta-glucosidase n=1 Tax=Dacryopinax primogenitus (strain DJM 731) TaxID=1858805 RepID=M5G5T4_DACPD|nr:putative beta-glucosidase from glycoside hydrolase family GH3 [Dacryopinax primogenitus]EJU05621.1 putative beta-glucosidase from glycoside hydrolase family GH3 [Dacryopinax primogenitus]
MNQSFLKADVADLVGKLFLDEKISLISAPTWWDTNKIPRLEIPSLRMSDGPNGVRGSSHFKSNPAQCIPCETAMASTWDPELIQETGKFLAIEAKTKAAVVLLAPTCNIQRSPLGGRAFESFSEDSFLSGTLAAAYVKGLQSNGVSACIKHFVANDQEHERTAVSSEVSERALREVYLMPFMIAQRDAKPWSYMTSYGRLNGTHCAENPMLLRGILRGEWGFDGLVMSDWFGTYSTDAAIKASLDLEMPGPPRWRTPLLIKHLLSCQKLFESDLDERCDQLLKWVQKVANVSPEIVYGDGEEHSRDDPKDRAFNRKLAGSGIVLLKNKGNVLPLKTVKSIAIMGPNAKGRVISGGGSAALMPTYVVTPHAGIVEPAKESHINTDYTVGCYAHRFLPTVEDKLTSPSGTPGWRCTFFNYDNHGKPTIELANYTIQDTRVRLNDFLPNELKETWFIKLEGTFTADKTCAFEFGVAVAGAAKLYIDGKLFIDNWTKQQPGEFFYGQGSQEEKAVMNVIAGKCYKILIEYTNEVPKDQQRSNSQPALMRGLRLGGAEKIDPEGAIQEAVELAKKSEVAVVVVGLTPEWESEGFDRPTMDMPGRQNELITRVAAANPNTVVVVQAGSAISMPWVDKVAGVVQAWYLGNEVGNAIADVLFGRINPSGRLPLSLPKRMEDIPAHNNYRSENGKVHYAEDLFVGYKHYIGRGVEPLFPFGFGLSYTNFQLSDLKISSPSSSDASLSVEVSVKVTNTGKIAGSEVVQLYVKPTATHLTQPQQQLRAFGKAKDLAPGASTTIALKLSKYAVSYYDDGIAAWRVDKGEYGVLVGQSSVDLPLKGRFKLDKSFTWTGL